MSLHREDARSKQVVFVANCLLNANNKVREFARYPGMFSEVIHILDELQLGIMQLPCPEVLYMGNQRWWNSRNLYDNAGYRALCRRLSEPVAQYMENYRIAGYEVVAILTCDGSPSCGITMSSYCEDWGGRPKEVPRVLVKKPGIFMEELLRLLKERELPVPPVYGLAMDDREQSNETILSAFRNRMTELCSGKVPARAESENPDTESEKW